MTPRALEDAAALLAELRASGVRIELAAADRLRIGPPDLVDDVTIERCRAVKDALLRILSTGTSWPCVDCGNFRFHQPTRCYWCRNAPVVEA